MAWVSVHQQIINHRKTRDLFRKLKISRQEAIGFLVLIWLWALDNADRTGKLLSTTVDDLEQAGYWQGEPGDLYKALIDTHWIDEREDGIYLHDWDDFNKPFYQYVDRKEKDKQRKREGKSAGNSTENLPEFHDSHSPSHSPSPKERDIEAEPPPKEINSGVDPKNTEALKKINNKAMEFGMNCLSPEFIQDSEMRLLEGTDPELIIKALAKAKDKANSDRGVFPYAISILQGWAGEGIKTMAQWNEKHAPKTEVKPPGKKPSSKPPQAGNYEQRKYDDSYFEGLYKDVDKPGYKP